MATLTEIVTEIDNKPITFSHYIPLKYGENANNLAINVSFVLKHKTRLILSNPNEQVTQDFIEELPRTKSPNIKWIQEKGLSAQDMRDKRYEIGVTRLEIQNIAIKVVESYVDKIVKGHQLLSNEPSWYLNRLKVELVLPIYLVYVYRGVLIERGPKPADALTVRDLKRVRVEESTIDADEQCSVCFEKLVDEQEQLIVLPCEHVFHEDCVTQWLKIGNLCPLCRFELPAAQEIKSTS